MKLQGYIRCMGDYYEGMIHGINFFPECAQIWQRGLIIFYHRHGRLESITVEIPDFPNRVTQMAIQPFKVYINSMMPEAAQFVIAPIYNWPELIPFKETYL